MQPMHHIGLAVHTRTSRFCVMGARGRIYAEGFVPATRCDLER